MRVESEFRIEDLYERPKRRALINRLSDRIRGLKQQRLIQTRYDSKHLWRTRVMRSTALIDYERSLLRFAAWVTNCYAKDGRTNEGHLVVGWPRRCR